MSFTRSKLESSVEEYNKTNGIYTELISFSHDRFELKFSVPKSKSVGLYDHFDKMKDHLYLSHIPVKIANIKDTSNGAIVFFIIDQ